MSVGKKFADFSFKSLETGDKTKLSKFAGKGSPVVVILWEKGNPECASALQALEDHASGKSHIVSLVVNCGDSKSEALDFLTEKGIRHCKGFYGKLPKEYACREGALPFHIVIDEDGKIAHASEDTTEDYINLVA